MIRIYDSNGERHWYNNGQIISNIETVKNIIREEMEYEKKLFGNSNRTFSVVPISFEEVHMCVDMPMLEEEVSIADADFDDSTQGLVIEGHTDIASFLYAWVEKQSEVKGYDRDTTLELTEIEGNNTKIVVKPNEQKIII